MSRHMFTVTDEAASVLKAAKKEKRAPRDAGIRVHLDTNLWIQAIRSRGSDSMLVTAPIGVMRNLNKRAFAFSRRTRW